MHTYIYYNCVDFICAEKPRGIRGASFAWLEVGVGARLLLELISVEAGPRAVVVAMGKALFELSIQWGLASLVFQRTPSVAMFTVKVGAVGMTEAIHSSPGGHVFFADTDNDVGGATLL
jgi:hypothetical protein